MSTMQSGLRRYNVNYAEWIGFILIEVPCETAIHTMVPTRVHM